MENIITPGLALKAAVPGDDRRGGALTTNNTVSETNKFGVDAVELNPNIEGSMAHDIVELNSSLANIDSRFNYSTDEQVIGTWIDGKPIYRKYFHAIATTPLNTGVTLSTDTDIDTIIGSGGCISLTNGSVSMCAQSQGFEYVSPNVLKIINNFSSYQLEYNVYVEYTKPTE